jgi:dihydrolipoamide dehydrogenase
MTELDVIVVGGGPGGYEAALHAAGLGLRTALVEKRELGGACLNRGCVPTKALLHAAELYAGLSEAERWGLRADGAALDFAAAQAHRREIVADLRDGVAGLLRKAGVAVFAGTGQLLDARTVRVTGPAAEPTTLLAAVGVLLATGAAPAALPLPGADLPAVLDSDALLEAETLPASLLIIGGGVIGVEFAGIFAGLGTAVTLLEARDRLLPDMDREIGQNLAMILKKRGVRVHTTTAVRGFAASEGPGVRCIFEDKTGEAVAEAEAALVCVGRRPSTEGLLAVGCGLEAERGRIPVGARGRTALSGVWAAGDLTGGVQLAHYATAQAVVAVDDMAGRAPSRRLDVVPACVYTDPEIACVGLTADEAKAANRVARAGKCVLGGNARTRIAGAGRSFIKLVADADTGALLGAQLMCGRASDIVGMFALAVAQGLTLAQVREVMCAHPTFYEAAGEALDAATR